MYIYIYIVLSLSLAGLQYLVNTCTAVNLIMNVKKKRYNSF